MNRIIKYILIDILRTKVIFFYTIVLAILAWSILLLENNADKGLLSLLNIILLNVPLVAIIFSTIYLYNSFEFIELLIAQPLRRSKVWCSLFAGVNAAFIISYSLAIGLPIMILGGSAAGWMVFLSGGLISVVFTSLGFLSTLLFRDKTKGIGFSILLWLFISFLFDGILMFILFQFADYPIEPLIIFLASLNPIDLARITVLLQLDMTAMLGYTGALFKENFGSYMGVLFCAFLTLLWMALPFMISIIKFKRKDH